MWVLIFFPDIYLSLFVSELPIYLSYMFGSPARFHNIYTSAFMRYHCASNVTIHYSVIIVSSADNVYLYEPRKKLTLTRLVKILFCFYSLPNILLYILTYRNMFSFLYMLLANYSNVCITALSCMKRLDTEQPAFNF